MSWDSVMLSVWPSWVSNSAEGVTSLLETRQKWAWSVLSSATYCELEVRFGHVNETEGGGSWQYWTRNTPFINKNLVGLQGLEPWTKGLWRPVKSISY
jgi:hypothetical protein